MSLEFSSEQEQVASLFTAYRNDIDIYTEDETKDKPFYKRLFTRLLSGTGIKINDIYTLGTSNNVISACSADIDNTRKKLYIVDGDIYLMFSPKKRIPNLYVLDAYCMENLVIDEGSVCNTVYNFYAEKDFEEIKNLLQFNKLIEVHQDALITLFYHKALEKKFTDHFTLKSIAAYYDRDNHLILDRITAEQDEIKARLISNGYLSEEKFQAELESLKLQFPINSSVFMKIISGKDFMIHMIACHASSVLKRNLGLKKEVWKFNMANFCKLDRLADLRETILNTCNS